MNMRIEKKSIVKLLKSQNKSLPSDAGRYLFFKNELTKFYWKVLNQTEKRKERLKLLELISNDVYQSNYVYYKNLIIVYNAILNLIKKINNLEKNDAILLYALEILWIELEYIDESIWPNDHVDINAFNDLKDEIQKKFPNLNFSKFCELYKTMYRHWSQKPNFMHQEINDSNYAYNIIQSLYQKTNSGKTNNYDEDSLLLENSIKESWKILNSWKKQDRRRSFLKMAFNRGESVTIKLDYYKKMISTYDLFIDLLERLKTILKDNKSIYNAEIGHLRICAIILIAKSYFDEAVLPKHHIKPHFIATLAEEYNDIYPDLHLSELSKAYAEMYELWPDKPEM